VLCVVDDAQWVDRPSAEALVFAARRLRAERLAMVFGAREGEALRFEAAGLPEIRLAGLAPESAVAVLASRAGNAVPAVRERLLAEATGNPLALMELPGALSEAQLEGRAALPEAIPLTPRLEAVFRQRAAGLPQAARTALLVAAADTSGDLPAMLRAAAGLGLPLDALDPAEDAGLVRIAGRTIAFRHPLVRSALYQGATASQRQRAHNALAAALHGDEHADRRVWHQAMATLTGDEEVAAALEASARRAQLRAGHASAATAFLRAAELSSDKGRRVQRIAAAAQASWEAGQPSRAREAVRQVLPGATGELRAVLLQLSGLIERRIGSLRQACARFADGAEATSDPSARFEMLFQAVQAALESGAYSEAIRIARAAIALPQPTAWDEVLGTYIRVFERELSGESEEAQPPLTDALRLASELDDPRALLWAGATTSIAGDTGSGLPHLRRAEEVARSRGLLSLLPVILEEQSLALFAASCFEEAYAAADEGYRLATEIGHNEGWHLTNMARIEAVWGREQDAREHAERALAIGLRGGSVFLAGYAQRALAFTELSVGQPELAADRLLALTDPGHSSYMPQAWLLAIHDVMEAAWRAGRQAEAVGRLELAERWARRAPTPARLALIARCRALLGQGDPDQAFRLAVDRAAALPTFERARTELVYGEWLRRERQRTIARAHLRTAFELFQSLRASPWAERADAELRATGETVRRRNITAAEQLTPQELQIARLVADGLTNKEIAAQLYLSPRTVDYHLRKVFTKLGIGSRTELLRHGVPAERQHE